MIKGIIFDLDGVYFKNGKKNFVKNMSLKYSLSEEKVKEIFLSSDMMNKKYKNGKISGDEFWNYAIQEWRIKSTPEEILKILQEDYEVNDKAIELMKRLRVKGFKSIICSNNFKERIRVLDERFNFTKDFDFVVLSYDYGIQKPELLKEVIKVTGYKPQEILVIDDGEKIITEAKNMGFKTILCKEADKIEDYLNQLGLKF